jgi:predicted nuclease of restriction endonuclease-like (RecB) superfamily
VWENCACMADRDVHNKNWRCIKFQAHKRTRNRWHCERGTASINGYWCERQGRKEGMRGAVWLQRPQANEWQDETLRVQTGPSQRDPPA